MKKGFTLIELLIVIAILAILTTVLVLVINPAELFRQARDSQRMSDLGTLNKAVGYYISTVATSFTNLGPYGTASTTCGFVSGCPGTLNASTAVTGSGWVGINLTSSTGGSPLARLPIDPVNSGNYFYTYKGNANLQFELDARLESTKYASSMTNDGGDDNTCTGTNVDLTCWYEIGNSLTL